MRVIIPIHEERVSSVFDAARLFALLRINRNHEVIRTEVPIDDVDPIDKAKQIVALGTHVLICGAISWPVELLLLSRGVQVVPNTCGLVNEIIAAFVSGKLTEKAFLMPGCTGQRRNRRCHRGKGPGWHKQNDENNNN